MNIHALYNRFELITLILFSTRERAYFSAGQKICLHQERAAIMHAIDVINADNVSTVTPAYEVPAHINTIINRVQIDLKL
ncbi:hypothetical protein QO206_03215 [Leeuwenhoekiella aequorea]|uniref:hypothetical protein n=1 Tax=Leeuwenhoekiella aequorea TaxID=283736 RepID=UPI00352D7AB7|tara:strand:+ start:5616 stop:5855 length:240 start_codon:yes stop_codon:yes gene_type:complete